MKFNIEFEEQDVKLLFKLLTEQLFNTLKFNGNDIYIEGK